MQIPDDDRVAAEMAVWAILQRHVGPGQIITAKAIARQAGIRRERKVRETISDMVNSGRCPLPIIGVAGGGYYVSCDPREVEEYADNLRHLGREIFKRRDGILATARRCGVLPSDEDMDGDGQMEMVL